jgi:hypothetical protein
MYVLPDGVKVTDAVGVLVVVSVLVGVAVDVAVAVLVVVSVAVGVLVKVDVLDGVRVGPIFPFKMTPNEYAPTVRSDICAGLMYEGRAFSPK